MKEDLEQQRRLIGRLSALLSQLHGGEVEVVETHLSWVLLVDEYAYKLKKAIRFAFADFSTLALRERNCRDELVLNRRFAPQLYLEVVAIRGSADRPTLAGDTDPFDSDPIDSDPIENDPIEYAVKLRRFASEDELSALLVANSVTALDLRKFGEQLAAIHDSLPGCGDVDAVQAHRTAIENVAEMIRFAPPLRARLEPWSDWLQQEWRSIESLAAERQQAGRIRECHGDLHVRNVVKLDGGLIAFDCIEFNRALRCIDVASDVAFLAMDLQAHDRSDLAYAFLSGWFEGGGDHAAVAMLRFFKVHRALVRAKVAVLERNATARDRYLDLAQRLIAPSRPRLIITCGFSGSGKTWLSERLVSELPALRIRSDVERKRLAGLRPQQSSRSLEWDIYSREFNRQVYEHLARAAEKALRAGESVIVDAAFLKRGERLAFRELAARCDATFSIVHCVAPEEHLRDRLRQRQAAATDASEADESVMLQQQRFWEPFDAQERESVLVVRTDDEASVTAARDALRMQSAP